MTSDGAPRVLGWDVGGVNVKTARDDGPIASAPLAMQDHAAALPETLRSLATRLGYRRGVAHAVTMTAELSQAFRTKREGVGFVLDAMTAAFPADPVHIFLVDGCFVPPDVARRRALDAGASNWMAAAVWVARFVPDGILIDIGTTSTDIVPLVGGRPLPLGRTDPARLLSRELVYTGAVRTPAEALVREVPLHGSRALVAAEWFATIGDAHIWLGRLDPADYTVPTADGRAPTREFAGERLARVVCGDRELLDDAALDGIAKALAAAQLERIAEAIAQVLERCQGATTAVVAGLGDFIGAEAARRAGLEPVPIGRWLGEGAPTAPAAAVARLLAERLGGRHP
jgi:probable H4MPT-linked C1 transfer pathway protein